MNKMAIVLDDNGDISSIVSDDPIRCFIISKSTVGDEIFELTTLIRSGEGEVEKTIRDINNEYEELSTF